MWSGGLHDRTVFPHILALDVSERDPFGHFDERKTDGNLADIGDGWAVRCPNPSAGIAPVFAILLRNLPLFDLRPKQWLIRRREGHAIPFPLERIVECICEVQCTRQLRLGRHDIRQKELVGSKKLVLVDLARLAVMRLDSAKDRMPGILALPATTR